MQKSVLLCVAIVAGLSAAMAYRSLHKPSAGSSIPRRVVQAYASWRQAHGKLYATPAEDQYRLAVFHGQLTFVEKSNAEYEAAIAARGETLSGPMFEMNAFGDLTNEEFLARYAGDTPIKSEMIEEPTEEILTPSLEDTEPVMPPRSYGLGQDTYVPKVKDQGACSSCWAFSACVELEKIIFERTKTYVELSVQEVIDCDTKSNGCISGLPEDAFNFARANGLHKASDYPYVTAKGFCNNQLKTEKYDFSNLTQVGKYSFNTFRAKAASDHKVFAAVQLKCEGKFRYLSTSDDVYDASLSGECEGQVNHGVTMINFGFGKSTITILNSWGTEWGYGGYKQIKICAHNNLWGWGGRVAYPYNPF